MYTLYNPSQLRGCLKTEYEDNTAKRKYASCFENNYRHIYVAFLRISK